MTFSPGDAQPSVERPRPPSAISVYVGTGTDKRYPFPRLLAWVEAWGPAHLPSVQLHVQAGITPSPGLPSVDQYAAEELDQLLENASAVVIQGGASGIMRARAHGVRPIVVPRYGSRGEAADDHQATFANWAASKGMIVHARSEQELHAALDRVLAVPEAYRFEPEPTPTAETVQRIADRIEQLVGPRVAPSGVATASPEDHP